MADINAGAWEFAHGYALLRSGQWQQAGAHLAALKKLAEISSATTNFGARHPARRLLGVLAGILDGEIARSSGNAEAGIASLERAVALDDELTSTNGAAAVSGAALAGCRAARRRTGRRCRTRLR
jgi:hypothetical protein